MLNRAGRVIAGCSYNVRPADVLNNLKWKTFETGRFHTKAFGPTLCMKSSTIYLPSTEQLLGKTQ